MIVPIGFISHPEFWDYAIKYAPLYVIADKLNCGDVPETVYREMFRCAAVKIELNMPDADGAIASKPRALYINMHRNEWSDVFEKWWVDWNAPIDVDAPINQYLA